MRQLLLSRALILLRVVVASLKNHLLGIKYFMSGLRDVDSLLVFADFFI